MGIAKQHVNFTGSVGDFTFYKIRGSDKVHVRKKGGPSKEQVAQRATFATTRKNNKEFGGRAKMTSQLMAVLRSLKSLGDYNIAGPLNTLLISLHELDTEHTRGQRSLELTKAPHTLKDFNLNRRTPFDSIITDPLEYTLSKEELSAHITIPELVPGKNFMVPGNFSWYKVMLTLGITENMYYHANNDKYTPIGGKDYHTYKGWETAWQPIYPGTALQTFTPSLNITRQEHKDVYARNCHCLLLGIGIAFGVMSRGQVNMAKYIGGGKIVAVV